MANDQTAGYRLDYLIRQYMTNTCTKEEMDELLAASAEKADIGLLKQALKKNWDNLKEDISPDSVDWEKRFEEMMESIHQIPDRRVARRSFANRNWRKIAAAVFILIGCGLIWRFVHFKNNNSPLQYASQANNADIQPGSNKAVLTLANGSKIVLDNAQKGTVARQGNTQVIKINGGLIAYSSHQRSQITDHRSQIEYNTINTPRGGQYEVILPDGSKVWLNAASSLTFPTAFTGNERKVILSGEGYFEIKPLSTTSEGSMPFRVQVNKLIVNVLGTGFNVMAYQDENNITTTLINGSVKLEFEHKQTLLKPGQQSLINNINGNMQVSVADTAAVLAWKEGFFRFDNTDLKSIMRQISRWYNVDIHYADDVSDRTFTGMMPRTVSLSHILEVLTLSNVHFKVEGKMITVLNK
jgi:ferric-dicitrate binding protein FerR (iron transport regulator)